MFERRRRWAVYQIVHRRNGRVYVGMTCDPDGRWREHRRIAWMTGDAGPIYVAMRSETGPSAFIFEIVADDLSKSDAADLERVLTAWHRIKGQGVYNRVPPHGWPISFAHFGRRFAVRDEFRALADEVWPKVETWCWPSARVRRPVFEEAI